MKNSLAIFLKQHAVIVYFVLAYALSWAMEIPLAASAQGWLQVPIPPALHYLASFGPLLSKVQKISGKRNQVFCYFLRTSRSG